MSDVKAAIRFGLVCGAVWFLILCALHVVSSTAAVHFPGERPLDTRLARSAEQLANRFWDARGVHAVCHTELMSASSLSGPDAPLAGGRGTIGAPCKVWVRRSHVPRTGRSISHLVRFCYIIVHEIGHNRRLTHSPSGVMGAAMDLDNGLPWECRGWALRHWQQPRSAIGAGRSVDVF